MTDRENELLHQPFVITVKLTSTPPTIFWAWAEDYLPASFTVFDLPAGQRVRPRTTNDLERINREIKRRTLVALIFPNTASCLRFLSALLAERGEERMTAKIYLNSKN